MTMQDIRVQLGFTSGQSDKVYLVDLAFADGSWHVSTQYGRRGTRLNAGGTVVKPDWASAMDHFNSVIKGKLRKGYVEERRETFSSLAPAPIPAPREAISLDGLAALGKGAALVL